MNVFILDRVVLLILPTVSVVFAVVYMTTGVPKKIGRLYSFRVNMLAMLPFSTRWQREVAPEHVDAYRRQRRWHVAGLAAIAAAGLLQFVYFDFLFLRLHGWDVFGKNLARHTAYTTLRPENDADKARAATVVADIQRALAKYQDYRVAEADGFHPLTAGIKLPIENFTKDLTKCCKGGIAAFTFSEPDSLLYQRSGELGYKLIGATYLDYRSTSEDQLNERVPLSVARWRRHVDTCYPGRGADAKTLDWSKFDSIATKQACDAVGGRFEAQLPGWTLQVHPWEQDPKLVWAQ